jgi:hypothetical protein
VAAQLAASQKGLSSMMMMMMCSVIFKMPDDGQSPKTQNFYRLF